MTELVSAFIGAVIGGAFSLLGTWLALKGQPDYFDNMAMKHLSKMLKDNPNIPLEKIVTWGKSIGLDEPQTKQLAFLVRSKPKRWRARSKRNK
jgi:hypothetical protein